MRIVESQKIELGQSVSEDFGRALGAPYVLTVSDYHSLFVLPAPGDLPDLVKVIVFVREDGQMSTLWDEMSYGLSWHNEDLPSDVSGLDAELRSVLTRLSEEHFPEDSDGKPGPDPFADPLIEADWTLGDRLIVRVEPGEVIKVP